MTQADILSMYVGNWKDLNLKQRRKVMAYVQAQRSKHAKEIFLKELSAIGRKFKRERIEQNRPRLAPVDKLGTHNEVFSLGESVKDPVKKRLEQVEA